MSESTTPNFYPRRIESPSTPPETDFVAASPQQLARLRYLGIAVQEPLANSEAARIIEQTNNDPALAEKIEAWETEKQPFHPTLFQAPPRSGKLSVPASSSLYAPTPGPENFHADPPLPARPSRFSPAKFLPPVATVAVLAVLGTAGWFAWKSPRVLPAMHKLVATAAALTTTTAAPTAPEVESRVVQTAPPAAPATSSSEGLAQQVAESQRLAVAKYPALGVQNTEINSRFVFRYKRMLQEHSPRLQDPTWPLQLADECAAASGLKPSRTAANKATAPK